MAQAEITINSVAGSNTDLPLNTLVQLNNVNAGGEITYLWSIAEQPAGTADVLSSTSIQNPTFTPTKEGTYLITLVVNQGTQTEADNSVVAAIRQLLTHQRIPAATETNEANPNLGWGENFNQYLQLANQRLGDPGIFTAWNGATLSGPTLYDVALCASDKHALPNGQNVPVMTTALASSSTITFQPLATYLGPVDGVSAAGSIGLSFFRKFGMIENVNLGTPTLGAQVFVNNVGALSQTAGGNVRCVGQVIAYSGSGAFADIMFDGSS